MSEQKSDRPRDASSVVVFDRSSGELRILMGRRQPAQVFMPGKFVFPGGRVDPEDKLMAAPDDLHETERTKLLAEMKGTPSPTRAVALVMAAIREAYEEAGLIIGEADAVMEDEAAATAAEHPSWASFINTAHRPAPGWLTYFARAITPPGRPRRFDTRFFCIDRSRISDHSAPIDGELSDLNWYSEQEIKDLDLAPITQVVLEEFTDRLREAPIGPSQLPVPFYYQNRGVFRRDWLGGTPREGGPADSRLPRG